MLLTSVIDMFMFYRDSDTNLISFLKGHIYKPYNSDGMF